MSVERFSFDVLVLGAGSAGCALAARLSEDPARTVGLVEAGPDYGSHAAGRWPADLLDARFDATESHDWGYAGGLSNARARVIGGCSSHNGCGAYRGAPRDYDGWRELGLAGWSWEQLRPAMERAEAAIGSRPSALEDLGPMHRAFLEAAAELGYPSIEFNDAAAPVGASPTPMNARGSIRWNAAFAYLDPARDRANLTILADTVVDRLDLDGGRVTAVRVIREGRLLRLSAALVVLAAGSFGSPAILMRSGIGPARDLARVGIETVADLPGVGAGMLDHAYVDVLFEPTPAAKTEMAAWLREERPVGGATLKAQSSMCPTSTWDLLLGAGTHPTRDARGRPVGASRMSILTDVVQSASEGSVRLVSRDPEDLPVVDHAFLSDPDGLDLAVLLEGIEIARSIGGTNALRAVVGHETAPGPTATGGATLVDAVRASVLGDYHPIRTCRMAPPADAMGVVDEAGRVRGTANLHVVDASIIPVLPRASINLTVIAVAEKLAREMVDA